MKLTFDPPQKMNVKMFYLLAGILIVTFLAFSPTLKNGFTNWDDKEFILENPYVQSLDAEHVKGAFTTRPVNVYVPLTLVTFAVEHHFFGFDPFVYHLNNLLLHLGVTALVFLFLLQLGMPVWVTGWATFLFGVHPMHVQSVAWLTERKDVLYAFFYMLALVFYAKYLSSGSWGKYSWSVVFGIFSILAKPMALSLPLILLLVDWIKGRPFNRKVLWDKVPFVLYVVGIALVTYLGFPKGAEGRNILPHTDFWGGLGIWLWTFSFYVQKFFVPIGLSPDYILPQPISLGQAPYLIALAVFLVCAGVLFYWRRNKLVVFGFAFFLGSIFFVLRYGSWVNYTSVVSDRFSYLPSLGLCVLSGVAGHAIFKSLKIKGQVLAIIFSIVLALVAFCLVGSTFCLSQVWNNSVGLWTYALKVSPEGAPSFLIKRGYAYLEKNEAALAMADARRAIDVAPNGPKGYALRGLIFHMQGKDREALEDLNRAIQIGDQSTQTLMHRAALYLKAGALDLAIRDCNTALALDKDLALAYSNRGKAYELKGNLEAALQDFDRAIFLKASDPIVYYNRANIYFEKKDYSRALLDLNQALALKPDDYISLDQRASVYYLTGKMDLARKDYDQVLSLAPDYARGYNNRGTLFLALEQYDKAESDYTRAIALDATDGMAYFNRSIALQAKDRYAEALADAEKAQALGYVVDVAYLAELRDKAPQGAGKRNGRK